MFCPAGREDSFQDGMRCDSVALGGHGCGISVRIRDPPPQVPRSIPWRGHAPADRRRLPVQNGGIQVSSSRCRRIDQRLNALGNFCTAKTAPDDGMVHKRFSGVAGLREGRRLAIRHPASRCTHHRFSAVCPEYFHCGILAFCARDCRLVSVTRLSKPACACFANPKPLPAGINPPVMTCPTMSSRTAGFPERAALARTVEVRSNARRF